MHLFLLSTAGLMSPVRRKDDPAVPAAKAPDIPPNDVAAKVDALRADNSEAAAALADHIGTERWASVVRQCESQGLDAEGIAALCGKMRRTRREWHPDNDAAALQAACIGLLCAIGSVPSKADIQALETALQPAL